MIEELKKVVIDSEQLQDISLFNSQIKHFLKNIILSDLASLYVYDKKTKNLNLKLFYNREEDTFENIKDNDRFLQMLTPQGCIGKVFLTKSLGIYNYITSDKDYVQSYDNVLNYKLKSQLIYPIMDNEELLGILCLSTTVNSILEKYTSKEIASVNSAAPYLVKMIKNIISNKDIDSIDFPSKSNMVDVKEDLSIDDNEMLLFLSNTVHDIRTPANTLYGFLELLEEQIEDKRLREYVTNAKESASFINTLTDTILETAKNRFQSNITNKVAVCPIKFLSGIANAFSAQMLEKKIHYFIFIEPNMPKEIKIDTIKLQRILSNLIGNAYKFTPVKHQINLQILWDESNNRIAFSIKDTGIGIAEEDQEKLFKSFSQARDDISHTYGGSGLGLAISAGYVSEMGGELKLRSHIDEGSEFYFDIPVEIVDNNPSYEKFHDLEKKIVILTEYTQAKYPAFIQNYLIALGIPKEKIIIANKLEDDATHVICFEEKINSEILEAGKSKRFQLLLIEQKLFSLLNKTECNGINITSKNSYNADAIYSTLFSEEKLKVLIVDDNKINVTLLTSMLSGEYLDISTSLDGEEALTHLKDSAKKGKEYDIVYLDKHMQGMSGTELLQKYRKFETKHTLKPIYAVSISGDPDTTEDEKNMFDMFANKPFDKKEIVKIVSNYNK